MKVRNNIQVKKVGDGTIRITHAQSVKQSIGYQTGDVSYGVEICVLDTPSEIEKGIKRCEKIVEDALGTKLPEMQTLLSGLADQNAK